MPHNALGRPTVRWLLVVLIACLAIGVALAYRLAPSAPEGTQPAPPAPPKVVPPTKFHVAADGRDASAGTADQPLRTITEAIFRSRVGGTIVVGSGSYHEQLKIENRDNLTITAAPGAEVWLDGSTTVEGWRDLGSRWVSSGWRTEFNHSPTFSWGARDHTRAGWSFINPAHPMAAHPDQVWIGQKRLTQVESAAQVRTGSFYVDDDNDRLYVGSDPTERPVRASSIAQALRIRSPGVLIRGIGIRRYAPSVPHMGAVTVEAPDVTLHDVAIVENATSGLHIMRSGVKLRTVSVERNGMVGVSATNADNLELERVVARENNVERFNPSPSAGGVKIGRSIGVVVRNSRFEDNLATGLWFDESVYDIGVFHSTIVDNAAHGISVEVSGKADVVDNVIARNGGNGIKINDSDDVRVWNNTFVGNDRPINVVQDTRDVNPQGSYRDPSLPLTWQTRNVAIRNNVISGSSGNCLLCVEDFSDRFTPADLNITAMGNVYHRPDDRSPKWLVVWSRADRDPYIFKTLTAFRTTVGQEDPGHLFTGAPIVTPGFDVRSSVDLLAGSVAQPMPDDLAPRAGVVEGTMRLGAWSAA